MLLKNNNEIKVALKNSIAREARANKTVENLIKENSDLKQTIKTKEKEFEKKLKIERAREKVLKASDIGREFWSKETGTFTLPPVDSIKLELEMALNRLEAQKQVTEEVRR